jgi:hypothetical protein
MWIRCSSLSFWSPGSAFDRRFLAHHSICFWIGSYRWKANLNWECPMQLTRRIYGTFSTSLQLRPLLIFTGDSCWYLRLLLCCRLKSRSGRTYRNGLSCCSWRSCNYRRLRGGDCMPGFLLRLGSFIYDLRKLVSACNTLLTPFCLLRFPQI